MSDNKVLFSNKMSFVSSMGASNVIVTDEKGGNTARTSEAIEAEQAQEQYRIAHQDGWKACEQQMAPQIQALNVKINDVVSEIPVSLSSYFQELESQTKKEVGKLAFTIAKMILKGEIAHEDRMRGLIAEALVPVMNLKGAKLYLNPEFAAKLRDGKATGIPMGVEVFPDPNLSPGEAIVESPQGIIDATLEGRIEALKEAFDKMLEKETAEQNAQNA